MSKKSIQLFLKKSIIKEDIIGVGIRLAIVYNETSKRLYFVNNFHSNESACGRSVMGT